MLPTHRKPTLPGKILLEEFLEPLGISQSAFAAHLGGSWTQPKLSAIIHGKRSITEQIALDFSDALGMSPEFWLGLQSDVHLWEASQNRTKISRIRLPLTGRRTAKNHKTISI
ncbi:HigA family addiction module antitoxin [Candidatus Rhabdochlamydia sp. T3358]|uniref:HigA family addiction module antitoxin n=1 Tax=Candidatus Rhabdochlamydia sp. T3358 TaxID=2099795 RepID=UPI0010B7BBFE|nr:HigA family addiction module antitoxin [Candidatus Rhabdochlamydia sp. T3358]VHO03351.1 putative HTH-type transcriptional regulator YbaQ [Candidatus Rhabdochlamydia sp. T3358]